MTNEDRYRLRQLCMAWTKNHSRSDAINEVEMAFLATDALDEMEALRLQVGDLRQELAVLASKDQTEPFAAP
jgi:hypothetical protein